MDLYIPLATGQSIRRPVYESLARQTIDINIYPCCTPGVIRSNHTDCPDPVIKQAGEVSSRNMALEYMRKCGDDLVSMQDSDIVHLFQDNFAKAIDFMKSNLDFGAVALPWRDEKIEGHTRIQALIFRTQSLENFSFRNNDKTCLCFSVMEDMAKNGWKYEFLPSDKKLITELI